MKNKIKRILLLPRFFLDFLIFKKKDDGRFKINLVPYVLDRTSTTSFEPHYIYHPAWAIRIIAKNKPELHVDFSSMLNFCTMLSSFVPVHFYDYRPAHLYLDNLETKKGDLTKINLKDNSVESLSCMHTVEHIGLGRYGDVIDPQGDLKAINELKRVLSPGGTLLFVVPVGKPRIEFNGHRVYSYEQIMKSFSDLILKEFTLIPDNACESGMIKNASKEITDKQNWGCGCFWFTKE